MQIIWHILLTVCMNGECRSQDVQWFDSQEECKKTLEEYRSIPRDGEWHTVVYVCKPMNASAV
jgi:hypothetical protein